LHGKGTFGCKNLTDGLDVTSNSKKLFTVQPLAVFPETVNLFCPTGKTPLKIVIFVEVETNVWAPFFIVQSVTGQPENLSEILKLIG
jgi:hypothetical protein